MTRDEIANELFITGKEVRQYFLNEITASQITRTSNFPVYSQYLEILNNLNLLYHSLDTGLENFDQSIAELTNSVSGPTTPDTENDFISQFLSILNDILINTIRFRKNYCLIRRNDPVPGLASHMITNLGQIVMCLNNGYIPIIDTVNATNIFTDLSRLHTANAWELYFTQPFSIKYEDIVPANEIKIVDGIPGFMPTYHMDCLMNQDLITFWRTIIKKYMPFSAELDAHISSCLQNLPFSSGSKILGVLCRGTDYTNMRPYNHPVQPSPDQVFSKTDEIMDKYQCDYCYLATEDREILNAFRKRYPNRLLTTQEIYYDTDLKDTINQTNINNHADIHSKNMEYLTALALLSKCQYFTGGRTSGTVVSLLLSDGFEESCIWDCGRYGIDDISTLNTYIF